MKNKILLLGLLGLVLAVDASAAGTATTVPAVLQTFAETIKNMIGSVIAGLIIIIMFAIAAWEMFKNANPTPAKWALGASLLLGAAIYFGPSMVNYGTKAFAADANASSKDASGFGND